MIAYQKKRREEQKLLSTRLRNGKRDAKTFSPSYDLPQNCLSCFSRFSRFSLLFFLHAFVSRGDGWHQRLGRHTIPIVRQITSARRQRNDWGQMKPVKKSIGNKRSDGRMLRCSPFQSIGGSGSVSLFHKYVRIHTISILYSIDKNQ